MKQFTLTIECDNAAFEDDLRGEIAEILRCVAADLSENLYPNSAQWLNDVNGNRVGTYKYEER